MKRLRYIDKDLDATDLRLIKALAEDSRQSLAKLGRDLGLSAPTVAERMKRLEEAGVITGYATAIAPEALGLAVAAWLRIRPLPGELVRVAAIVQGRPEIVQCDRITGDDCFIAKAYVGSMAELETLIDSIIPYATTNTSIIQSSPVRPRLPAF